MHVEADWLLLRWISFSMSFSFCWECDISTISSAKVRCERHSPSMLTPLSFWLILPIIASWRQAVKSIGEMLSPCLAPLSSLIFSLSRYSFKVEVAPLYRSRSTVMYAGSTPWFSRAVEQWIKLYRVKSLFIIHRGEAQWNVVFTWFSLDLTYCLDVVDCGKHALKPACSRGWWLSIVSEASVSAESERTPYMSQGMITIITITATITIITATCFTT